MRILALATVAAFLVLPGCAGTSDDGSTSDTTASTEDSTDGGETESDTGSACVDGCPTLNATPVMGENVSIEWVDLANETASIKNSDTNFVDVTAWQICAGPGRYGPMGMNTIPASSSVVVDISALNLDNDDALGIYSGSDFEAAADIRAFVQWGAPGSAREMVAADAALWTAGTYVTVCDADTLLVATGDVSSADAWQSADSTCAP